MTCRWTQRCHRWAPPFSRSLPAPLSLPSLSRPHCPPTYHSCPSSFPSSSSDPHLPSPAPGLPPSTPSHPPPYSLQLRSTTLSTSLSLPCSTFNLHLQRHSLFLPPHPHPRTILFDLPPPPSLFSSLVAFPAQHASRQNTAFRPTH